MKTTDMSEPGFQKFIAEYLTQINGYQETKPGDYNKEFCVNTAQLFEFIEKTQEDAYELIKKRGERGFLARLDRRIKDRGIVEVLRKGIKHFDKTVRVFYTQPVSELNPQNSERYNANIFSVTQELMYSDENNKELDLVIFINGLPIITMELKNGYTKQSVFNGIRQYQNDRDPNENLFRLARCLVHFAADTDLVYMTTHLKGKHTQFLPFNKGQNDGKPTPPYGAGNPVNPNGEKTHYLWEEVLAKDSLSNIIERFAQVVVGRDADTQETAKQLIFPRYHQLKVVRNLLAHAKENGVRQRYLIQHSAGSGKSHSITWLAHQLVGLHDQTNTRNIFDSVIVVTDRTVLDEQIREHIKDFEQVRDVVVAITGGVGDTKTQQLESALVNQKKIIITTIQTFPFLVGKIEMMKGTNFAIIIDEAHSSQSGEFTAKMNTVLANKEPDDEDREAEETWEDKINSLINARKMLTNGSYFAFTATPKSRTLETFGQKEADGKFYPFHLYSMKQAIEEEFILDVLQNYTTYNSYYKLIKTVEYNPDYDIKSAQRELRHYVENHEYAITQKARIMIDHFMQEVKHRIHGQAKAMVVTSSIPNAIKYKEALDAYLKELNSSYKAIVAFSGTGEYKGIEVRESDLNGFPDNDNDIPKHFKKDEYKFLIVVEKFQTGFDQPLLHTMYVDKKLAGVHAVQTLSRLNRAYKPHKKDTFVLDFVNTTDDIREAFEPYYTTTILSEETDPNRLNDLQETLADHQVYSEAEVQSFCKLYYSGAARSKVAPILDTAAQIFRDNLSKEKKIDFKTKAKSFERTYNFLGCLLDFNNPYWEELWLFLKFLIPKLTIDDTDDFAADILDDVDMEIYRVSRQGMTNIALEEEDSEVTPLSIVESGQQRDLDFDSLENIIETFNQRFGDIEWEDSDKVRKILSEEIPNDLKANSDTIQTIQTSDQQNAKIASDRKLAEFMQKLLFTHTEIYKKFTDDPDFKSRYEEFIFDILRQQRDL